MDGVLHHDVQAAVGIGCHDAVAPVADDQVVEDHGAHVAAGDGDTAVAAGPAITHDPVALEPHRQVLPAAAERDAGAAGPGDRETANRDEARLLHTHRVPLHALLEGTVQDYAARRRRRISLDNDTAGLRLRGLVLAGDADLLDVRAGLDLDGVASLRRVHRGLDAAVAW